MRQSTSGMRMLPDFLVIGAMRSGTSSFYKYLGYHPCIAPSLRKETQYFSRFYDKGESWYRSHFPLAARRTTWRALGKTLISFEATPDYIFHPHAAQRARQLLPNARIILLVRDPVTRAFSHYQHVTRHGWEKLDFAAALDSEERRIGEDRKRMESDPGYWGFSYHAFSYVARGLYAQQLSRWFQEFPRERFLVLPSEHLWSDPGGFYDRVLNFLDLPSWRPRFLNYSYLDERPAVTPLDPAIRQRLAETFRGPNKRLFAMLGTDLGWNEPGG